MAITPADIESLTFSEAKKNGYDTEEVDAFLDQLSVELDAMLSKMADLKGRLNSSEQQLDAAQAQVAQLKEQLANAPEQSSSQPSTPAITASEQQISQVLIVAQQSADKLVADARATADNIRNEADQKAREVIRQALSEKQAELDEIDRLKQSREDFRGEYKRLLQHFMDDADAVFPQMSLNLPSGSVAGRGDSTKAAAPARMRTESSSSAPASNNVPALAPMDGFDDLD